MRNTKKRVIASLIFSLSFYIIWILYDIYVYKYSSNKNVLILAVLCTIVAIPLFLFSTFLVKNDYKIITGKIGNYLDLYIWIHIVAYLINIALSGLEFSGVFIGAIIVNCVAILITYYLAQKICDETILLADVSENKKLELIYQDAITLGVSALTLSSFLIGGINFGGKSLYTVYIIVPVLIFILLLNYMKIRLMVQYKIIHLNKILNLDNFFIVLAMIVSFVFSNSNMLNPNDTNKSFTVNIFILLSILMLTPLIKTNKKIGAEQAKIKSINEEC